MDKVLEMMERCGGSFVNALAACYRKADPVNRGILEQSFSRIFETYRLMVKEMGGDV